MWRLFKELRTADGRENSLWMRKMKHPPIQNALVNQTMKTASFVSLKLLHVSSNVITDVEQFF